MGDQMQYLIDKLKEITELKTVDLYYNQDENKLNILSYPAVLVGIQSVNYDKADRIRGYERKITAIILLFNASVSPCKDKELQTMTLNDKIFQKFVKDNSVKINNTTYLERTSTLTCTATEVEITGDTLL